MRFRLWGLGFRTWGLGHEIWGLGLGVYRGLGFRDGIPKSPIDSQPSSLCLGFARHAAECPLISLLNSAWPADRRSVKSSVLRVFVL